MPPRLRVPPLQRLAPSLTSRPISTTSPASRPPPAATASPNSFQARAQSLLKPRPSNGKPTAKERIPFNHRKPAPAPSSVTAEVVLRHLENLIKRVWIPCNSTLQRTGVQLGLNAGKFRALVTEFGRQAVEELRDADKVLRPEIVWEDTDVLRSEFIANGLDGLHDAVFRAFLGWCLLQPLPPLPTTFPSRLHPLYKLHQIARATDFRHPGEIFYEARQLRRKIILHVGPTNSGKTHRALVALARATNGVYAGPLRLLAHEVFSRFNEGKVGEEGKRVCNLITGEEQRIIDVNAALSSCTVEMFPLNRRLAVGVIDEIQMIGDPQRGAAWTMAVLGSQCEELHLCGEESVVDLIQTIAKELGDECVVNRYQRLSPLAIAKKSLGGDLSLIKKGDCLVTFSRNNIFAFKRFVEDKTGLRVAVAYGGLPPEVREEQARAFNEGEYDVLVASDAIGMGLNLKINRIVFETLHKWDGKAEIQLPIPQIKQIAGRAGRFGVHTSPTAPDDNEASANTTVGEVTTLDESDMDILRKAMAAPVVQVTQASIAPTSDMIKGIHNLVPPTASPATTLQFINNAVQTTSHYSPRRENEREVLLDAIEHVQPLSFEERSILALAPVNTRDPKAYAALVSFAESFARGEQIMMDRWSEDSGLDAALARVAEEEARSRLKQSSTERYFGSDRELFTPARLAELESFHRCLTSYLWLAYRLPDIFCNMSAARPLRKEVEKAIDYTLAGIKFERIERKAKKQAARGPHRPSPWLAPEDRAGVVTAV